MSVCGQSPTQVTTSTATLAHRHMDVPSRPLGSGQGTPSVGAQSKYGPRTPQVQTQIALILAS